MVDVHIDRDLVGSPPKNAISAGYERLFDAHLAQSVKHFSRALPSGGLLSLFSRTRSLDAPKLGSDFEVAYRKLLTDTAITLPDGQSLAHDAHASTMRPVLVFLAASRDLIVPEQFSTPTRRIVDDGSVGDGETIASCFPFELIATIDRVLRGTNLSAEQRKKTCEVTSFDIAMEFDDGVLAERVDGQEVAPILCYSTSDQKLVLVPSAAQHDYVHGGLDEYFAT